jgi:hypothetical protein
LWTLLAYRPRQVLLLVLLVLLLVRVPPGPALLCARSPALRCLLLQLAAPLPAALLPAALLLLLLLLCCLPVVPSPLLLLPLLLPPAVPVHWVPRRLAAAQQLALVRVRVLRRHCPRLARRRPGAQDIVAVPHMAR